MATNNAARLAVFNAFVQKHEWARRMELRNIICEDIAGDTQFTFVFDNSRYNFSLMAISDMLKKPDKLCERLTFLGRQAVYIDKNQWRDVFNDIYAIAEPVEKSLVISDIMTQYLSSGNVRRATTAEERDLLMAELRNGKTLKAVEYGNELAIYFLTFKEWIAGSSDYKDFADGKIRAFSIQVLQDAGLVGGRDWTGKLRVWRAEIESLKAQSIEWELQEGSEGLQ